MGTRSSVELGDPLEREWGFQVPKVEGNTSRSLRWKDYRSKPHKPASGLPIPSRESSLAAWVRVFKFLKLEETLPDLFGGRITDQNPSSRIIWLAHSK